MAAVLMRLRSELRSRRRPIAGLALLVALGATVVMAAAAGARRTDSAYPRFLTRLRGADFVLDLTPGVPSKVDPARISRLPQVSAYEPVKRAFFYPVRGRFIAGLARSQDPSTAAIDRFKIVEGRAANPNDPSEVVLSLRGRQAGLRVGDTFPAALPPGDPFTGLANALRRHPITMRVVGVAAVPGGFPPLVSETQSLVYLTPAFFHRFPNGYDGTAPSGLFRLKRGATDLPDFEVGITRLTGVRDVPFSQLERRSQDANVQRSFHLQALALWLLVGLAALAFVLILSQIVARQLAIDSDDNPTLSALGMSRAQLWITGLARVGAAALAGALLAVPAAFALSTFAPIGLTRTADPSPGFAADWTVLGLGVLLTVLVVVIIAAIPAWSATRAATRAFAPFSGEGGARPSAISHLVARWGAGPSAATGVRLALERGRGRTAVPVRTSIAGVSLGIAVVAAAVTFGASLQRLIATPRLYGVPWDMVITSGDTQTDFSRVGRTLLALPEVRGVAVGRWGLTTTINGLDIDTTALDPEVGDRVAPPVLEGRAPSSDSRSGRVLEIVLGTRTMRRLGLHLGQLVRARVGELELTVPARVVGRGVIPSFNESARLGDGAWISYRAGTALAGIDPASPEAGANTAFLILRPNVVHGPFLDRAAAYLGTKVDDDLFEPPVAAASDIVNFGRVRDLPQVLGGVLALFATATLIHTLVTSIRRRRRDLAILKTIGFVRGQVRRAVATHALTLTILALFIGIPVGVAVGRWLWAILANGLGVVSSPIVPVLAVSIAAPVALVAAGLVAALPARSAARTKPAIVLRSE
jgi:MacB-like periplasmic core domain/FtsX-like permease family